MTAAIDVRNITKKFGSFTAVNGISFTVDRGETLALLGPNGAGKSTLIRIMTTLMLPTSGTAIVNGADIVSDPDTVRHAIGVIPQAMTSDLDLSCRENLSIFAKLYSVPRERRERLIDELLAAVDLTKWADKEVKQLSGGMRRRLEIARGLVHEPKIFFLDEPTTGLDPVSRKAVWDMLERIKRERDLTILITTHMMDEADHLCDRIAIVDHGQLMALDSPIHLKAAVPGENMLEVLFSGTPPTWKAQVSALAAVAGVTADGDAYHISSTDGPATTMALLDAAARAGVTVKTLGVQSTTLDDVFVYFTGRQLHGDQAAGADAPDAAPAKRRR
ncbi:MAG TPA: ATP-binding cassette domain-containing protein [Vicinamibacterales bacterium]